MMPATGASAPDLLQARSVFRRTGLCIWAGHSAVAYVERFIVLPDPDHPAPAQQSAGRVAVDDTLRIRDFGDEVHLWIECRVPWDVALKILRVLKEPAPPNEPAGS
jgi:hypothetical protein